MQPTTALKTIGTDPKVIDHYQIGYYPESDGKPVGETDTHISAIFYLRAALRFFFRHAPDTYTAADMLFYYEEGKPTVFKVPDVYVVKGIAKHDRRIYKLWEERVPPCVIIEVTSRGTKREDTHDKKALYERLGVAEYFLFDPLGEYLKPRFQGFRLIEGHYQPITPTKDGTMISLELGVILRPEEQLLRLVDPKTGKIIPSMEEANEHAYEVEQRAMAEAQRATAEAKRAAVEAQRATAEAQRAATAEAENVRLRAELEQLRRLLEDKH